MANQELYFLIKNELDYLKFKNPKSTYNNKNLMKNNNFMEEIFNNTLFLSEVKDVERLYCYLNNITQPAVCQYCNVVEVNFGRFSTGYVSFCGDSCSRRNTQYNVLLKSIEDNNFIFSNNVKEDIINLMTLPFGKFALSNPIYKMYENEVSKHVKFLSDETTSSEKLYYFVNNIISIQRCDFCNSSNLTYNGFFEGHSKYCSVVCGSNSPETKAKIIKSMCEVEGFEFSNNFERDLFELLSIKDNGHYIRSLYNHYKEDIDVYVSFLNDDTTYIERVHCYANNLKNIPKCQHCRIEEVKFINFLDGYAKYCGRSCSVKGTFDDRIIKSEITCLEKYGVTHFPKSDAFRIQHSEFMFIPEVEIIKRSFDKFNTDYGIKFIKFKGLQSEIEIICSVHGKQETTAIKHLYSPSGCPECDVIKYSGPIKITKFLVDNNIEFIPEYRFDDCRFKNPLPFDFYLPELNVCIEFDGMGHYEKINHWEGDGTYGLEYTQNNDKIKTNYCLDKNIKLIRIPYWDEENIPSILSKLL